MAHRVRFLNNILWLLLLYSCNTGKKRDAAAVPHVYINAQTASLKEKGGSLYLADQPVSGYVYILFSNRDTAVLKAYIKGKQEGWSYKWYPGGQLMESRFYLTGKKEGVHRGWWENGKLKFKYQFLNDEYEGAVKEWSADGKLFRSFHYTAGHEEGLQQMWWDDGKLRANYFVKSGQQYGLIGRKLCSN